MIRDLICLLLFQKIPKNDESTDNCPIKKSISDDYIAYKIVYVRIFTLTLQQL